jgi:hypothetical protein
MSRTPHLILYERSQDSGNAFPMRHLDLPPSTFGAKFQRDVLTGFRTSVSWFAKRFGLACFSKLRRTSYAGDQTLSHHVPNQLRIPGHQYTPRAPFARIEFIFLWCDICKTAGNMTISATHNALSFAKCFLGDQPWGWRTNLDRDTP